MDKRAISHSVIIAKNAVLFGVVHSIQNLKFTPISSLEINNENRDVPKLMFFFSKRLGDNSKLLFMPCSPKGRTGYEDEGERTRGSLCRAFRARYEICVYPIFY